MGKRAWRRNRHKWTRFVGFQVGGIYLTGALASSLYRRVPIYAALLDPGILENEPTHCYGMNWPPNCGPLLELAPGRTVLYTNLSD